MLVDMVAADYGPSGRVPLQRGTDYNVFCSLLNLFNLQMVLFLHEAWHLFLIEAGRRTKKDQ